MITLDENHVYHDDDGRDIISVTQALKACGLIDVRWSSEWHRERGKAAHSAVEYYEQGDLDEGLLSPVISPYLEGWKKFNADTGYVSTAQERIVYNRTYRYCGTLDQEGVMDGATCLIDLKTGPYQFWWAYQTAAYNAEAKCRRRYSLELREDGTYRLIPHKDKRDFQTFLACLTVANIKIKNKIKD